MKQRLILGGTNFIGRNLVRELRDLDRYDITLFNRGITNAALFPELKRISGDRNGAAVRQIGLQDWDYVIDVSCYYPDSLARVRDALREGVRRYVFVSTCSVYDNDSDKSVLRNEDARTLACSPEQKLDSTPATYGHRKAECERLLRDSALDHTILRPALVYGPYDATDRFYYWLYQVKTHARVLLPDQGRSPFSVTYVMDLVQAMVRALEREGGSGTYNVTSTPRTSIRRIVDCVAEILDVQREYIDAPAAFLHERGVQQWSDMPLWLDAEHFTYSHTRLLADFQLGLAGFQESVASTIRYYADMNWPEPRFGMPERRRQMLLGELTDARRGGRQ